MGQQDQVFDRENEMICNYRREKWRTSPASSDTCPLSSSHGDTVVTTRIAYKAVCHFFLFVYKHAPSLHPPSVATHHIIQLSLPSSCTLNRNPSLLMLHAQCFQQLPKVGRVSCGVGALTLQIASHLWLDVSRAERKVANM